VPEPALPPLPAAVPAPVEPVIENVPFWMASGAAQTATIEAPATKTVALRGGVPPTPPSPAPVLTPIARPAVQPMAVPAVMPDGSAVQRAGFVQAVIVGAILGLVWRLLLVFPADLYARLLGSTSRTPLPGSLEAWLQVPAADEGFLRLFVLATWWVGALVGVILVWRGGGRFTDLVCGLIAGAVAGLGGSATLACGVVLADTLPRMLLQAALGGRVLGPGLATPLWIVTTSACWLVEGAVLGGVLVVFGRAGTGVLALASGPLVWVLRVCGMGNMANFFALRG
jgi:hypothetical protein